MKIQELFEGTTQDEIKKIEASLTDLEIKFDERDFTEEDEVTWLKLNDRLNDLNKIAADERKLRKSKQSAVTKDPAVTEFAQAVKKYCQPYLKLTGGDFKEYALFRGIASSQDSGFQSDQIMIKQVRLSGRRPADTGNEDHIQLNKWMTADFGEPFRNAMFASPNPHEASQYGDIYLVVPMGEFTYLWSPKVLDLYGLIEGGNQAEKRTNNGPLSIDYLRGLGYTTENFLDLFKKNNEVMIRCKEYIAFNIQHDLRNISEILDEITNEIR